MNKTWCAKQNKKCDYLDTVQKCNFEKREGASYLDCQHLSNKEYSTLDLVLYWGKLQPSGQTKKVESLVTGKRYDMSLEGFLYYVTEEEAKGNWIIIE